MGSNSEVVEVSSDVVVDDDEVRAPAVEAQ